MTERLGIRWTKATYLWAGALLATGSIFSGAAGADPSLGTDRPSVPGPADRGTWSIDRHASIPVIETHASGLELILDDGSREADIGFGDVTASQFMWLNQFARGPSLAIDLREIQVLFPPGPGMAAGNQVELVVYLDPDGDPTNGAQLLTSFIDEMQVVDGVTFSVYPLAPPVRVTEPGDVLIGVVNRFVKSGMSPPSRPAALDTDTSQGRSWVALWTGDPPDDPELPPDLFLDTIDFLEPGNWLIRGGATPAPIVDVPALGPAGLAALAGLIALAGGFLLRRRTV